MTGAIFIAGGGSGIGRALADALHERQQGHHLGTRTSVMKEAAKANPGMELVELDIENRDSIADVANSLVKLLGTIRMTSALIDHLKQQPAACVIPRARKFIDETIRTLGADAHEVLTGQVGFLRNGAGPNDAEATKRVNGANQQQQSDGTSV